MIKRIKNISIKVNINTREYDLTTYAGEYSNLMVLLYDQLFIEDFGECKGIGRCGTCHIYILNPSEKWLENERNENSTLSKIDGRQGNSRLACQMNIDESMHGLHIQVVLSP